MAQTWAANTGVHAQQRSNGGWSQSQQAAGAEQVHQNAATSVAQQKWSDTKDSSDPIMTEAATPSNPNGARWSGWNPNRGWMAYDQNDVNTWDQLMAEPMSKARPT